MPVLNPQQANLLATALLDAFGEEKPLAWVVRSSLGSPLNWVVNTNQAFVAVVADLLEWMDRQGPGAYEALLRAALGARPANELLKQFCIEHMPSAMRGVTSSILIKRFNSGLQLLIDMKDNPIVRQTVGGARENLDTTRRQIQLLMAYKGLHDALHEVQMKLDAIMDALSRPLSEATTRRNLKVYARDLAEFSKNARSHAARLPARLIEDDWIDTLEACGKKLAIVGEADTADLRATLRELLSQASRINSLLVSAANNLRLDSFANAMRAIANSLQQQAGPADLGERLVDSSTAVTLLRSRLDGLVFEHNEWQLFSARLNFAEVSPKFQPEDRLPKWTQSFAAWEAMYAAYPDADWAQAIKETLHAWIDTTSVPEPGPGDKETADIAFAEFHRTCVYRFYRVDKGLVDLCDQITEISQPLDTLLTAVQ